MHVQGLFCVIYDMTTSSDHIDARDACACQALLVTTEDLMKNLPDSRKEEVKTLCSESETVSRLGANTWGNSLGKKQLDPLFYLCFPEPLYASGLTRACTIFHFIKNGKINADNLLLTLHMLGIMMTIPELKQVLEYVPIDGACWPIYVFWLQSNNHSS